MIFKMKLGIDLGGSHIGIGLIKNGKVMSKWEDRDFWNDYFRIYEEPSKAIEEAENSILEFIIKKIRQYNAKYDIEEIGFASPGDPIQEKLIMKNLVNLGINELNLNRVYEKIKIPIKIKNDSKAAAEAEYTYGALQGYNDSVFLCLGTGIGSAVFLNGKLLKANKHIGFELGHMVIDKNGIECNCGKRGCFETYCSIKRFKESEQKALNIDNRFYVAAPDLKKKIKENMNNMDIQKLIDEFIENMIIGLSNIIDIFEPEAICLGGSFVFFKDIFYDRLISELNARKYYFNKGEAPKIVLAKLNNDAGMIGATI